MEKVYPVEDTNGLLNLMVDLNIQPDSRFDTPNSNGTRGGLTKLHLSCAEYNCHSLSVFTVKRFVPETGVDLYYVFNNGINATTLTMSLENSADQAAYEMNVWSGEIQPVMSYIQRDGRCERFVSPFLFPN